VNGALGIGKEALGYWFTQSGLTQNDFKLYVTRLSTPEVLRNAKAFGVDFSQTVPFWFSRDGGLKFEVDDLASLSFNIKDILKKNSNRRTLSDGRTCSSRANDEREVLEICLIALSYPPAALAVLQVAVEVNDRFSFAALHPDFCESRLAFF
jgi:KaiC/GvpD/RAD55 family RecA-like ATPase